MNATASAHALRIAAWQLCGAFALFGVATALDLLAGVELPRAVSGVAMLVGAQAYASAKELKSPGEITGRYLAIAARAALLTTIVQVALSVIVVVVAARGESELDQIIDWGVKRLWVLPVAIAVAYGMILGMTVLGLSMGAKTAAKAAARRAA